MLIVHGIGQQSKLADSFMELGTKSEKDFFRAKCKYNAGRLLAESERNEDAARIFREIIESAQGAGRVEQESAPLNEYGGHAAEALYKLPESSAETRHKCLSLLFSKFRDSVPASLFLSSYTSRLSGGLNSEEWLQLVEDCISAGATLPDRITTDVIAGLKEICRRKKSEAGDVDLSESVAAAMLVHVDTLLAVVNKYDKKGTGEPRNVQLRVSLEEFRHFVVEDAATAAARPGRSTFRRSRLDKSNSE